MTACRDACFPLLVSNLTNAFTELQKRARLRAASRLHDLRALGSMTALRSVTTAVHRLRPVQMDGGEGDDDDDDMESEDSQSDAFAEPMSPRSDAGSTGADGLDLGAFAFRSRLPELAGDAISHEPTQSEPADAYICVDGWSKQDQLVAEAVRAHLTAHGLVCYVSQHPKVHLKHMRSTNARGVQHVLAIAHDGRASPAPSRPGSAVPHQRNRSSSGSAMFTGGSGGGGDRGSHKAQPLIVFSDHRASPSHSRRPSVFMQGPLVPKSPPPGSAGGGAAVSAEPLEPSADSLMPSPLSSPLEDGAWAPTSPPPLAVPTDCPPQLTAARALGLHNSRLTNRSSASLDFNPSTVGPKRAKSITLGTLGVGASAPMEDLFELNASRIDAATMMIYIASAVSFKSADCTDELHYGTISAAAHARARWL